MSRGTRLNLKSDCVEKADKYTIDTHIPSNIATTCHMWRAAI